MDVEVQRYSFFDLGGRWGWVVNVTPRPLYAREREAVPILQEAGRPQGRSAQVRKISSLQGFDPRTIQPVASIING